MGKHNRPYKGYFRLKGQ